MGPVGPARSSNGKPTTDECNAPRLPLSLTDFALLRRLGDGSYSTVVLARQKSNNKEYALKIVDKQFAIRQKIVEHVSRERRILDLLDHPGVVKLHFTFQDTTQLYFGLEVCPNGELFDQIQLQDPLPVDSIRFYAAQLVSILSYLKQQGVVHRDIKPENLLLTEDGHLKLVDFGTARMVEDLTTEEATATEDVSDEESAESGDSPTVASHRRCPSLVGTAEYVSPEMLRSKAVTCAADLWGLGCILAHMLTRRPPFKASSEYLTFQLITDGKYELPDTVPEIAADLVRKLLQQEPADRLGASDMQELMDHPFFEGIDWIDLWNQPAPSFIPLEAPSPLAEATDWELISLQQLAEALPVPQYHYEYEANPAFGQDVDSDEGEEGEVGRTSDSDDESQDL